MATPAAASAKGPIQDTYQRILDSIAPNASQLKRNYNGYLARGLANKVRADIVPNNGVEGGAGGNQMLTLATGGDYLVRIKLSALRAPGSVPPRLNVYAASEHCSRHTCRTK